MGSVPVAEMLASKALTNIFTKRATQGPTKGFTNIFTQRLAQVFTKSIHNSLCTLFLFSPLYVLAL